MTEQEITTMKARIFALVGTGIAGFIGAYMFSSADVTSSLTSIVFLAAGIACFVIAGSAAKKLSKESVSK